MKAFFLAAAAAFVLASPAIGQNQQEAIDARYTRALGAGYKALFLCSAIANAERNGAQRSPDSVHQWELTGVDAAYDSFIRDLPFEIERRPTGQIATVRVEWADDMPDRMAAYYGPETGCSVLPVGAPETVIDASTPVERVAREAIVEAADPERFASGVKTALQQAYSPRYGTDARTTAALVRSIRDGRRVSQEAVYADGFTPDTPQRTWSVAKSIAATLVGAAVLTDEVDVADPIGLNYWTGGGDADPRGKITIDHALRMATGRYSDTPGNRTEPIYWGGSTVDENATKWPVINEPGTVFRYANNDTLMAVKAIERWLGWYPPHEFFAKIGMDDTVAETDIRGSYVLSSQVWSTADDLASLGQLYLNNGIWNGKRLLPENWREYVSSPSGPQPEGRAFGYGAGWWLMNNSEGVPQDTFAAMGNRGQYVVVVPSRNIVIVRRGEDPAGGSGFDIAAFTRDVLAAVDRD